MNPQVEAIGGSLIREIAAKRKSTSIDLGLGEPSLRASHRFLQAGMEHAFEHGLRYTLNAGNHALREAIAQHYEYPHLRSPENVCITTGSQEATYATITTLLDPRTDELLVVGPAFPSYAKMAQLGGARTRSVPMAEADDFAFDAERILAALSPSTRLIAICSPCNPTARVMHREAVQTLAEGLQRRGGDPVWVLHDEIYREQVFIDNPGWFAQLYPHTVVTNSVSKSNALTGLRLGWAMAPRHVIAGIIKVHAWVTSCADSFAQRVALEIFRTPGGLQEHAAWYAEHRAKAIDVLAASGMRYIAPEGSFYACVRLPEGMQSLRAAHALADECDVIAVPGIAFGEAFDSWLRLAWVSSPDDFAEGVNRIAAFCRSS